VLLRVERGALAQGSLFWQANNDAYDLLNFTATAESPPPPNRFPDVRVQWVGFWGGSHIRSVSGPSRSGGAAGVSLSARLQPGKIAPEDLVLNAEFHPGRKSLNVGAEAWLMKAAPRTGTRRR
jgi:hypothetical protein